MKARVFNPLRLDVEAFAEADAELAGTWPLTELPRLAESGSAEAPPRPEDRVEWAVRGSCRRRAGAPPEWRIDLQARTHLRFDCQRCLLPVEVLVEAARPLRFVTGEAEAAALDADSDEDVLALSRALDLRELVEDELLLSLPLVPRHEACPAEPQPRPQPAVDDGPARPHPFAALAALKKSGPTH